METSTIYVLIELNERDHDFRAVGAYKSLEDGINALKEDVLDFLWDEYKIDTSPEYLTFDMFEDSWTNLTDDVLDEWFEYYEVSEDYVSLEDDGHKFIWELEQIKLM